MLRNLLLHKFRYLPFSFTSASLVAMAEYCACVLMCTVYEKLHTLELGIQGLLQMARYCGLPLPAPSPVSSLAGIFLLTSLSPQSTDHQLWQ